MLVTVEAVGRADEAGDNEHVAQQLIGEGGGVAENPAGEDLPGTEDKQRQHGDGHEEAHDGIQHFFNFFQILSSPNFLDEEAALHRLGESRFCSRLTVGIFAI